MPATPDLGRPFNSGTVLAFDYGTRLIGVAVGSCVAASARALTTIANGDWRALDAVVADWRPEHLVTGLPLALDGSEQAMSRAARAFASELEQRFALPLHLVDERHTSNEAARRFAEHRARGLARRKDAISIDALAAQIILEAWLAEHPGNRAQTCRA